MDSRPAEKYGDMPWSPNLSGLYEKEHKDAEARKKALDDLVQISEEMGLYDGPTVCLSHMRYLPCRKHTPASPCAYSDNPEDVEYVRRYLVNGPGYNQGC
jgi:hypothetical protein